MTPRVRRSNPDLIDLSDPVVLDKFISDSVVGSEQMYSGYTEHMVEGGANCISGVDALKTLQRVEDHVVALASRCTHFCPHISSVPFSKPHLWVPAWGAVTCLVCASDWEDAHPANGLCDLCLSPSNMFTEMNVQMGPGILVFHLGDCCIEKFTN